MTKKKKNANTVQLGVDVPTAVSLELSTDASAFKKSRGGIVSELLRQHFLLKKSARAEFYKGIPNKVIGRPLTVLLFYASLLSGFAGTVSSRIDPERMVDAIYRVEGGSKANKPYGILSVKVKDSAHARRICLNTVRNNLLRWEKAGRPGAFTDFLADRYCPPSVDAAGNINWKKNIKAIYKP